MYVFCFRQLPKHISEALLDEYWVHAMQDGLGQFIHNDVFELVINLHSVNVIGT